MKNVDSDALRTVNKALGLTGSDSSSKTELLDSELVQTLDISTLARRGRTQAETQGVYLARMQNVHLSANTQATAVSPYNPDVNVFAPYLDPVPDRFDVWMLAAWVVQTSGAGTISAILTVVYPGSALGWGRDQSGADVTGVLEVPLAFWDTLQTETVEFATNGAASPYVKIGMRMQRTLAMFVRFRSTSSAAATFDCQMLLGVFPVGMGQDVLTGL